MACFLSSLAATRTRWFNGFMKSAGSALVSVVLLCALATPSPASADESLDGLELGESPLTRTLSIGVGAGFMRFDSNFKFTDLDTGRSVFVDSEGTLGLPENKTIPIIYGSWRPSRKHGIGFGYSSVKRESELLAIDRNLGDLNLTGVAIVTDDSEFYGLTYNYTLFQDDRAYLFATLGIHVIDLEYRLDARGTISIGGDPIESGEYLAVVDQIAPLPTIGIDSVFTLTDKWSFGARARFVKGDVNDVDALITEAFIRARYSVNKNLGLIMGLRYFDADIDITNNTRLDEINYGLDGLLIGVDVGF